MNQKKVLVTGAAGGLGIPVVTRLLAEGWHVYAVSREPAGSKKDLFPEKDRENLSWLSGDLTDAATVEQVAAEAGSPEALVHLAGGFQAGKMLSAYEEKAFDHLFALNVRSAFLVMRALLPSMKEARRGSIVTIGAKPAIHPGAVNAVYAASKAALVNLTLSVAEEGRGSGVRANVIVPAVIRTAANAQWASSPDELDKWTPPEDIAGVVSWLLSPAGESVTGSVIPMYHGLRS